ncbi:hypothetical protein GGD66_002396 [Bradyrhizobium sp. CIR48]|nr:hypothetical protein [Bradyrhizobium sp. CIR48]
MKNPMEGGPRRGLRISAADAEEDDEDATKPLPDRLIIELTAHRTLALGEALAENPAVAFQAVLHNFVLTAFYRFAPSGCCLEIGLRTPTFPAQAPGLRDSESAKAVEARHEAWKARLPRKRSLGCAHGPGWYCASIPVRSLRVICGQRRL